MASTPKTLKRIHIRTPDSVPTKLPSSSLLKQNNPNAAIGEAEGIETLFAVSHATVVKFTTSSTYSRTASGTGLPGQHGSGTLPWATPTERTMAAGPLEIYRVPGSVSFLHSGALLHAIMPRSQCWCVDGVSKFAFRVLPDTYYRIDLPRETAEDLAQVEQLKVIFSEVLHYERTPCPFSRTFTVDLPEESPKLSKKRRKSTGPAKKWRLHSAYSWKPEGEESDRQQSSEESSGYNERSESEDNEETTAEQHSEHIAQKPDETIGGEEDLARETRGVRLSTPSKLNRFIASRSVTAPPQLTLRSTPPSKVRTPAAFVATPETRGQSSSTATPSPLHPSRLRTFQQQSVPVYMPPSPPDSSAGIDQDANDSRIEMLIEQAIEDEQIAKVADESQEQVEEFDNSLLAHEDIQTNSSEPPVDELHDTTADVTKQPDLFPEPEAEVHSEPDAQPDLDARTESKTPATPPSNEAKAKPASEKSTEDPYAQIQARILARRSIGGTTTAFQPLTRESSSSASSTSTLASDRSNLRRSQSMTAKQQAFASALVNKAATVFLGPPAYLVEIMLRIAKRIASGALKVAPTFIVRQKQRKVPGSFQVDSSDGDETLVVEDGDGSDLDEDDFGVPLKSPIRLSAMASRTTLRERKGWEEPVQDSTTPDSNR